jgi:hypothetical protein
VSLLLKASSDHIHLSLNYKLSSIDQTLLLSFSFESILPSRDLGVSADCRVLVLLLRKLIAYLFDQLLFSFKKIKFVTELKRTFILKEKPVIHLVV